MLFFATHIFHLVTSLYNLGAIGGLAHHSIETLVTDGLSPLKLIGGVGVGAIGVVTKPLGGAAELVAKTGKGLLRGVGWDKALKVNINLVL